MADGQVLIDSKLDTKGVEKGSKQIEKEFESLSKVAKRTAEIMENELNNLEMQGIADGMSDSFEKEGRVVEESLESAAEAAEDSAERISDSYNEAADDQSDAMKKAWNCSCSFIFL